MVFRPSDVIGLIWHHPIVSLVVLLLFTPPLFPIMVYFSPLLISTALFVLAMISMGSDHSDYPNPFNDDMPYSEAFWIEGVDVDGPSLGERLPKRIKASSKDERWFDKVKNWEGTGRAWVESVLSQEARKSFDGNAASRDESIPLLDKARGFFTEDVGKRSREDERKSSISADGARTMVNANDSAPSVPVKFNLVDHASHQKEVDSGKASSEIMPELESDDELIEIAPADMLPSPLIGNKSVPKSVSAVNVAAEFSKKVEYVPSEAPSKTMKSGGSVPGTDSEEGNKTGASGSNPNDERDSIPSTVEQKVIELEISSNSAEKSTPSDVSAAQESNSSAKEVGQGFLGEIKPVINAVSSGVSSANLSDENLAEKAQTNTMTEDDNDKSGLQSTETKSVAELLAPLRQGQASYGLGTPSAAVALSEKLKVPLADIMSLLAGDDKENIPNEGPSGVEASSSSEARTSQEEEWSNSDGESSASPTSMGCQS